MKLAFIFKSLAGILGLSGKVSANHLLLEAARRGDVKGINSALSAGAFVDITDPAVGADALRHEIKFAPRIKGATPLMYACLVGPDALPAVRALIDAGADVNYKVSYPPREIPSFGNNAIMCAAQASAWRSNFKKDAKPLIDALVKAGAGVNDGFSFGRTPLFMAMNVYDGLISLSAVEALLGHGADPNAIEERNSFKGVAITDNVLSLCVRIARNTKQGDDESRLLANKALQALVEAEPDFSRLREGTVNYIRSAFSKPERDTISASAAALTLESPSP